MIARLHFCHAPARLDRRYRRRLRVAFARTGSGRDTRVKLLAIDSATERLALALVDDGRAPGAALARAACRIEALDLDGGAAASAQALPRAMALL